MGRKSCTSKSKDTIFTADHTHYLLWKNTGPEELSCQKSDRAGINTVIWPTSNVSCRGHPVGGWWSQAPFDANGMTGASLDSMTRPSRTEDYSSHFFIVDGVRLTLRRISWTLVNMSGQTASLRLSTYLLKNSIAWVKLPGQTVSLRLVNIS